MTGPEHYREAERLLGEVSKFANTPAEPEDAHPDALAWQGIYVTSAQVHATLALAAATALMDPSPDGGLPQLDRDEWERVAATPWPAREKGAGGGEG